MEIRGVSSTTAVRPTAFQPTEAGVAAPSAGSVQPTPTQTDGTATGGEAGKSSGPGYISPYLRYDQGARVAVLYFRDFDTGETQDQIPSQRVVEEYRRAADRLAQDDQRKSARTQTASGDAADSSAGSTDGTASGAGSATTRSAVGTGLGGGASPGVSFASGSGGPAVSTSVPTGASAGTAPASGGFTPAAAGGRYGGSPGGLVSVTV